MPLNTVVVGVGFMGQLHARAVAEGDLTKLGGIVDRNEELGRSVAARFETRYFYTVEDALGDDAIEAYVVALPDRQHRDASVAILRTGKPLLLEKPMAHTLAVAREIAQAAAEGEARLLVGHLLRYDPRYVAAAQAVAEGLIGEPLHASAGRIASRALGRRMDGTSSVLFYLGVHDADAIQWVTGKSIRRVYSRAVSKLMPSLGVASEDAIVSVVEFDDGSVGQLFNGWTRTEDDPVPTDARLEVFGTQGHLQLDLRDHVVKVYGRHGLQMPSGLYWPEVNGRVEGDLAAEVAHFARAVGDGGPFVISTAEAMRAVAVNDAILRSVESGQAEEVEVVEADGGTS